MPGTGFGASDFFADLFALCLLLVPIFYLLPRAWARRALLTLAGAYLLFLIAPRLLLFYAAFWVLVAVLHRLVVWTSERSGGGYVLAGSIVVTLAPMVLWKLFPFDFTVHFNVVFDALIYRVSSVAGSVDAIRPIILPIGLSFSTFRAVDMLIQSYLGTIEPPSFGHILFYGFFPPVQVIGPVIEYSEIAAQSNSTEGIKLDDYRAAFTQAIVGAVKLFALAIPLASSANLFTVYKSSPAWTLWFELFVYTWYFYLNFSGYSDLAIAVARLFGFKLKPNFSRPLTRTSPQSFWNHWHMSLTRWAQRNVFVPLGGMRRNRQFLAIFATMMTIALWHDLSVPLVIFGVYHSCGLIGARLLNIRRPAATDPSWRLSATKATMLFVYVAISMPMLTLSLSQLGGFYKALVGFG